MLSLGGAGLAWAAQADATVREQYDALKASGVESDILCKPDAAGQMKDCQLVRPTWLKKPDIADLVKYYPPTAAEHGVGAFVTIECNVAPTGYLQGCKVLREDLQGEAAAITAAAVRKGAFGDAALELSKIFQARMERAPGEPPMPTTGVRIPIRFLPIPLPHAPAQPA
jgi:hypothetical protein